VKRTERGITVYIWFNGKLMDRQSASLSLQDRGVLYGDGLFETFRVEKGTPMFEEAHLDRLGEGARLLRFAQVPEPEKLKRGIRELLQANQVRSGYLRITLTRGIGGFGQPLRRLTDISVWMEAREHPLDLSRYEQGVRAVVTSIRRNPYSPLTRVKSLNYLESVLARDEAAEAGVEEGIFRTVDGDVSETASANLFLVQDGCVVTPDVSRGVLPGIVRSWVLDTCTQRGWAWKTRAVSVEELVKADEAFLTNSTWGPFPLVAVDGQSIGSGKPGPVTREWISRWRMVAAGDLAE
jgi:branched-chain amino acid aminotransferase